MSNTFRRSLPPASIDTLRTAVAADVSTLFTTADLCSSSSPLHDALRLTVWVFRQECLARDDLSGTPANADSDELVTQVLDTEPWNAEEETAPKWEGQEATCAMVTDVSLSDSRWGMGRWAKIAETCINVCTTHLASSKLRLDCFLPQS